MKKSKKTNGDFSSPRQIPAFFYRFNATTVTANATNSSPTSHRLTFPLIFHLSVQKSNAE